MCVIDFWLYTPCVCYTPQGVYERERERELQSYTPQGVYNQHAQGMCNVRLTHYRKSTGLLGRGEGIFSGWSAKATFLLAVKAQHMYVRMRRYICAHVFIWISTRVQELMTHRDLECKKIPVKRVSIYLCIYIYEYICIYIYIYI